VRLGGPVLGYCTDPEQWVAALQRLGYGAAFCPLDSSADDTAIQAYAKAAQEAGLLIAEVGAWSNPLSPDDDTRRAAISTCQEQLALADRIGARCCVNIAGSRGQLWAGPHPDNLTAETFDLIVATVRTIIDAVKPRRTFYTLEAMAWAYPDSVDSYLALIQAIDRQQFAVHVDPANWVSSPQRYYSNGALIRECFLKLGPYIRSCHAKDIALSEILTGVHLDEVRPGLGALDYRVYLQELDKLDPDTPLMMEHLQTDQEYALAARHIRGVAGSLGVAFIP
jgi:sugar phosphate isomerase/epimerase